MSTKLKIIFVIILIILIGAARRAYKKSPAPQSAGASQHEEAIRRIQSNPEFYNAEAFYNTKSNTSTNLSHKNISGIRKKGST